MNREGENEKKERKQKTDLLFMKTGYSTVPKSTIAAERYNGTASSMTLSHLNAFLNGSISIRLPSSSTVYSMSLTWWCNPIIQSF